MPGRSDVWLRQRIVSTGSLSRRRRLCNHEAVTHFKDMGRVARSCASPGGSGEKMPSADSNVAEAGLLEVDKGAYG